LLSIITVFCINTNYICDRDSHLDLNIRNNINGDFKKVEKIADILPGSFININWNNKKLMLPYSQRKGFISFSDLKWDWRYKYNENGEINEKEPILYELISKSESIEHKCKTVSTEIS
tara:strand:+ start:171 stop:524 length:354 start_codon:yes stop_codon:yes gene_type:complete